MARITRPQHGGLLSQTRRSPYLLLLGLAACAGCRETPGARGETDAGPTSVDAGFGGEVDARVLDASLDGPCVSTFAVSADCRHPAVTKDCADGFCKVPAGCFVMGSPRCQPGRGANTEPEAQVTLTHAFEIAQHETTQGEWTSMGYPNPTKGPMGDAYGGCLASDCPVGNVSWFEMLHYANTRSRAHTPPLPECYELSGCTGDVGRENLSCAGVRQTTASLYECRGYRLPTDAEWEYAARAGSRDAYYDGPMTSVSNVCERDAVLDRIAWYCDNVVDRATSPVERKKPNAWGLFDMLGNAWEVTTNAYDGLGPGGTVLVDPGAMLGTLDQRPKRGGLVLSWPTLTTLSSRLQTSWNQRGSVLGFRLVRTLP